MKATKQYTVKAIERDRIQVNRHGITKRRGGAVIGVSTWDDSTPYYLAAEIMQDEHPGCAIVIVQP